MRGDLAAAIAQFGELVTDAETAHDMFHKAMGLVGLSIALANHGEVSAARAAADAAVDAGAELSPVFAVMGYQALAWATFAAGDVAAARDAGEAASKNLFHSQLAAVWRSFMAQVALADGDLIAAQRWADDAVAETTGWHLMMALAVRSRVAIAQGDPDLAERDAYDALALVSTIGGHQGVSDTLECLATLAGDGGSHREAARLFGAAEAIRQRIGEVRLRVWDAGYEASVASLRNAMSDEDFEAAWAEGAGLSTEEAIAYAQRGRGERKRPASGWASLTPAELDVVRLVSEGLPNNDIATRLFVSPRTVQAHLTHVYTKLGLTSRVQLAQEAVRHA
jgi:DNA-binding CsgD family transcriptional regulator